MPPTIYFYAYVKNTIRCKCVLCTEYMELYSRWKTHICTITMEWTCLWEEGDVEHFDDFARYYLWTSKVDFLNNAINKLFFFLRPGVLDPYWWFKQDFTWFFPSISPVLQFRIISIQSWSRSAQCSGLAEFDCTRIRVRQCWHSSRKKHVHDWTIYLLHPKI